MLSIFFGKIPTVFPIMGLSPVDCPTKVWLRVHWSPYVIPGGQTRPLFYLAKYLYLGINIFIG